MKKIILIVLTSVICFLASDVQARNGIYLTAEAGFANQTNVPPAQDGVTVPYAIKDTSSLPSGFRGSIGYNHDLNRYFGIGLNVGAGNYGRTTYYFPEGTTNMYIRTLEFLGVGTFHIRCLDLFFRVGGIRETPMIRGLYGQENHTDSRPEYGIGAAYNFTPHVALMVSYAHVMGLAGKWSYLIQPKNPDLNETLFGIRYTF